LGTEWALKRATMRVQAEVPNAPHVGGGLAGGPARWREVALLLRMGCGTRETKPTVSEVFGHGLGTVSLGRLDRGVPADVGSTSMSPTGRTWLLLVVGAVLGLALGILVSAATDVPFAPEVGLVLGALIGWLSRRVST
jgi:hypothetical protein